MKKIILATLTILLISFDLIGNSHITDFVEKVVSAENYKDENINKRQHDKFFLEVKSLTLKNQREIAKKVSVDRGMPLRNQSYDLCLKNLNILEYKSEIENYYMQIFCKSQNAHLTRSSIVFFTLISGDLGVNTIKEISKRVNSPSIDIILLKDIYMHKRRLPGGLKKISTKSLKRIFDYLQEAVAKGHKNARTCGVKMFEVGEEIVKSQADKKLSTSILNALLIHYKKNIGKNDYSFLSRKFAKVAESGKSDQGLVQKIFFSIVDKMVVASQDSHSSAIAVGGGLLAIGIHSPVSDNKMSSYLKKYKELNNNTVRVFFLLGLTTNTDDFFFKEAIRLFDESKLNLYDFEILMLYLIRHQDVRVVSKLVGKVKSLGDKINADSKKYYKLMVSTINMLSGEKFDLENYKVGRGEILKWWDNNKTNRKYYD